MISFRFHVVSITAVFLAIAIGVVVGTTYVDGAVVDGLKTRIDDVSKNLDTLKEQNDQLDRELGVARDYITTSADYAVTDRLRDVPVLVLALRGVEEGAAQELVRLTRRAGATTAGVVWVEDRWGLAGGDDRAALAEILDAPPDDAADDLVAAGWAAVADELTMRSLTPDAGASTTTIELPTAPVSILGALESAGFLSVDSVGDDATGLADLAGSRPHVLLVTGARAREELLPVVSVMVAAQVGADLPTVVADVYVEAPEAPLPGATLADLLAQDLRDAVIVVDDAERPAGQVAAVLALDEVSEGGGRHYGYGDGADGVLPSWTPP